ncbi:hypothetical protein [Microbacterium caowuchunii]|nr:hypothetical protein [Microbacterium caowuchunii]
MAGWARPGPFPSDFGRKDDPAAAYEDELVAAVARTVLSAFQ